MSYKIGTRELRSDKVNYTFIAATCGNQPDVYQAGEYGFLFPALVSCEWSVTAGGSTVYNCIAWSVDVDYDWIGEQDIDMGEGNQNGVFETVDMDLFYYKKKGWTPTASGPSDAEVIYYPYPYDWDYTNYPNSRPSIGFHAARRHNCSCGAGQWYMFESKCGDGLRIEHVWDQLDGSAYGSAARYYK